MYPGGKPDRALGRVGHLYGGWGETNVGLLARWMLVLGVERAGGESSMLIKCKREC